MKKFLIAALVSLGIVVTPLAMDAPVFANAKVTSCVSSVNDGNSTDLPSFITNIVNILLFLAGAVAVIVIIIGGIRYVMSSGDAGQVQSAKNTILYAVIGLIVVIMAYAIVNFVINQFQGNGGSAA